MRNIIIDTDIGDDIDDAFAVALALNSPELEIKAIVSAGGFVEEKAKIAYKLVKTTNKNIPIFQGINNYTGRLTQKEFIQHCIYKPPTLKSNLSIFKKLIKKKDISYVTLGPLTNLAFLCKEIPEIKKCNFLIMGGTIVKNYQGKNKIIPEANIRYDIKSAQEVFSLGTRITMVGLDSTWNLKLSKKDISRISESRIPLNQALYQLYKHWKKYWEKQPQPTRAPILYDPFTIAVLIDKNLAKFKEYKIYIDNKGRTIRDDKIGNRVRVAMDSNKNKFFRFLMKRLL